MLTFLLPKKYFLYSIILIIYFFVPYDSYIINNQFSNTQNISQSLCPALNSVLSSLSRTTRNGNYSYNTLTITKLTSTNNLKICSTFSTPNSTCCSEQTEQIFRVAAIHRFNTLLATTFSNTLLKPYLLILQNISEVYQINIFYLAKSMVNDAENHLYDSILSQSIQNITRHSTTFTTLLNLSDLTQSYKHRLWDKLKPAIIHYVLHPDKNDYAERYKQCLTNIPDNLLVASTSNNFDHLHNLTDTVTTDALYHKTNASNEWLTRLRFVDMLQYTYYILAYGLQRQLLPLIYDNPLQILDRYNKTQSHENQYINIKQKPKLSYSTQCEWALTKMFYCQSCALDIPESHKNDIIGQKFKEPTVPPKSPLPICRGMCHNIASACLSDLEGLGTAWNHLTWILTSLFQQLRDLTLLLHQNQNLNATDDTLKNGNSQLQSSAFLRMIKWLKGHATRLENEVETKCGVASFIDTHGANSLTNIIHSADSDNNQTNILTQKLAPHLLDKNGGTTDEEWLKSILLHTNSILTQALSHIHNESLWRIAILPLKQSPQKRSSFKSYFGTAFDGDIIEKISESNINMNTYFQRQHSMKYGLTFSAVPDAMCALDESVSSNNKACWDGEMVGRYSKNLVKFGRQALLSNPEMVEIEDYFDSHSTVFDSSLTNTPLLNKPYQADTLINELNSIRSKLISMGILQQQSEKQLTSQFQNLQSTKPIVAMTTQPYTFPFLPSLLNKHNLKFHNNDENNQTASIETQLYASHTAINSPGYQGNPMISQLIDNSHLEKSFFNSDTNEKPSAQNSRDRPMLNNNPLLMDMEDGVKDTPSIPNSVMGSGMNPFDNKQGNVVAAQQLLNSDERFINTNINHNNNNKLARLNNAVVDDEDLVNALSAMGGSGSSPFNTYQQSSSPNGKTSKTKAHDDLLVDLEGPHHGLTVEGSGLTPDTELFENRFSKNLTAHGKGVYNDKSLHYSPSQHTAGPKIIDDIIARNDINQDGKSQRSTHTSDGFNCHSYNFQMTFLTIFLGWLIYFKFILIA